jgi:hypothetical protein
VEIWLAIGHEHSWRVVRGDWKGPLGVRVRKGIRHPFASRKIHLNGAVLRMWWKSRITACVAQLKGDPRRKSLCATPLKFNYVIKGWLKVIPYQKNIRLASSIKSGDHRKKPLSDDPNLHIHVICILRFFTILEKKNLLNTTWNRFSFEHLYWYHTWHLVR